MLSNNGLCLCIYLCSICMLLYGAVLHVTILVRLNNSDRFQFCTELHTVTLAACSYALLVHINLAEVARGNPFFLATVLRCERWPDESFFSTK